MATARIVSDAAKSLQLFLTYARKRNREKITTVSSDAFYAEQIQKEQNIYKRFELNKNMT